MADEKKTAVEQSKIKMTPKVTKGEKESAKKPVKNAKGKQKKSFADAMKRLGKYFKEVYSEIKKVSWPSKKDYFTHTWVVFVFVFVMTFIIFTMNTVLTSGLDLLLNIGA